MKKTGLYWFVSDLRIQDNPALKLACSQCDRLVLVFCMDPAWQKPGKFGLKTIGTHRLHFLRQSLAALKHELHNFNQHLLILDDTPFSALPRLCDEFRVTDFYSAEAFDPDFRKQLQWMARQCPQVRFHQRNNHCLFEESELPFAVSDLPDTFSKFRRHVEDLEIRCSTRPIETIPPPPLMSADRLASSLHLDDSDADSYHNQTPGFAGGAGKGAAHLQAYFTSTAPASYKQTRNGMLGWDFSSKWSPWLAHGCLSVVDIVDTLRHYERSKTANESTYWLYFELLWREYFKWYARKFDNRLYEFDGIKKVRPLTSYYPERFQRWCLGNTPYPIVNACMNELRATGFLSNRGRQLAASCLVNELELDWRYGAAYFQEQLLDYDPASNWGNWQYIANVGADPRGQRRFDLEGQTRKYDPDGAYIDYWQGDAGAMPLDTRDAADWPL